MIFVLEYHAIQDITRSVFTSVLSFSIMFESKQITSKHSFVEKDVFYYIVEENESIFYFSFCRKDSELF